MNKDFVNTPTESEQTFTPNLKLPVEKRTKAGFFAVSKNLKNPPTRLDLSWQNLTQKKPDLRYNLFNTKYYSSCKT